MSKTEQKREKTSVDDAAKAVKFGELKITLTVANKVVAESKDPEHWHQVMDLLTGRIRPLHKTGERHEPAKADPDDPSHSRQSRHEDGADGEFGEEVAALAREIGYRARS